MQHQPIHSHARAVCRFAILAAIVFTTFGCSGDEPEEELDTKVIQEDEKDREAIGEVEAPCDDTDITKECVELSPETIRIGREKRWGVVDARRDGNTLGLELTPKSRLREKLIPGLRMVRWRRDRGPIMVEVISVDDIGDNRFKLEVKRIGLKQAFKRGRLRKKFALQDVADQFEQQEGMRAQPLFLGASDCTLSLIDGQLPFSTVELNVGITKCSFGFTPEISLIINWGGLLPSFVELTATGTLSAELEAGIVATGPLATHGEERVVKLAKVPVPGFPILTIGLDLYAGYNLSLSAPLELSAGFEYSGSITTGFVWQTGQHVETIFSKEKKFTQLGPTLNFNGHADVRVYLKPKLTLSIVGVVGGYVSVEAFAGMSIDATLMTTTLPSGGSDIDGNVCYDFSVGLVPGLGLEGLFGLFSTEFQLPGVEWPIGPGACVDYSEVSSCTESDECVIDTDCAGGLTPTCEVRICTSNCTCERIDIEDCCTADDQCDDGDENTNDLCINRRCRGLAKDVFSGFCLKDDDCDDGSDATRDTCSATMMGQRGSCVYEPYPEKIANLFCFNDAACDDNDPTTEDKCHTQSCTNTPISPDPCDRIICNDFDGSTSDSCVGGVCRFVTRRSL